MQNTQEFAFSKRFFLHEYQILPINQERQKGYKKAIDPIITALKSKRKNSIRSFIKKGEIEKIDLDCLMRILDKESPDDQDLTLLGIGIYILREKSPWKGLLDAGLKVLKGGTFSIESFFTEKGNANCIDISTAVKTLAQIYGIESKVEIDKLGHAHMVTNTGKTMDLLRGHFRVGLFQTREKYDKFLDRLTTKQIFAKEPILKEQCFE